MWSLPGFWSENEQDKPQKCPEVALERCQGYDPATGESICIHPFTGPKCGACIKGYYPGFNNLSCLKCPKVSIWQILKPLLFVGGLSVLIFAMMFGIVAYAAKKKGEPVSSGINRTFQFVIWTVLAVQTIIQVKSLDISFIV
jgi:hypothetical protein